MIRAVGGLVLAAVLGLTGCSGDEPGDATTSPPVVGPAPGDQTPVWDAPDATTSVDPATVTADYATAVDALVAAATDAGDDGLTWGEAEVRTEDFEGTCAVTLERVGTGTVAAHPDDLQPLLAFAASDVGFDDLAPAADPGGAVRFVATDDAGALLEWRSKTTTTVAVRVATVDADCG